MRIIIIILLTTLWIYNGSASIRFNKVNLVSNEDINEKIQGIRDKMDGIELYTVREGDTLKSISLYYYGLSDLWQDIYVLNTIENPDLIFEGQILRVKVVK